jgi:3-methyladenine DNA glycosylase AlkD
MLTTAPQVLRELKRMGDPKIAKYKERYGIFAENSYGMMLRDVDALAKRIKKDDALALELFDSGVYEARLL